MSEATGTQKTVKEVVSCLACLWLDMETPSPAAAMQAEVLLCDGYCQYIALAWYFRLRVSLDANAIARHASMWRH